MYSFFATPQLILSEKKPYSGFYPSCKYQDELSVQPPSLHSLPIRAFPYLYEFTCFQKGWMFFSDLPSWVRPQHRDLSGELSSTGEHAQSSWASAECAAGSTLEGFQKSQGKVFEL